MQDFLLAFRALRATPIVTVVAALSLTLGIGANTAIFSLVNSLLLRPLPVKEPERLAMLSTGHDRNDSQFSTHCSSRCATSSSSTAPWRGTPGAH